MRFRSRLKFSRFITFTVILLIGSSLIALGALVDGLELYEQFGGISIGSIMCVFAFVYLKLNTKVRFLSISEDSLNLEYGNGEKAYFSIDSIELVENYDGRRYFAAQSSDPKRKIIIDPENFKKSDEMLDMILGAYKGKRQRDGVRPRNHKS